nr:hypothetical protein [Thermosediminibacter litoriperuensis]
MRSALVEAARAASREKILFSQVNTTASLPEEDRTGQLLRWLTAS